MAKPAKYKAFDNRRTDRWVDKKYLSSINYLRLLRRDLKDENTIELRTKLHEEVKKNKQEFKDFIVEYRIRGYYKANKKLS